MWDQIELGPPVETKKIESATYSIICENESEKNENGTTYSYVAPRTKKKNGQ